MDCPLDRPVLFGIGSRFAWEIGEEDVPAVQRLFDDNPGYFLAVHGEPARPDEARQEYDDVPPPEMSFRKKWMLGFGDEEGTLVGMANIWSDFIAESVWHIGLFLVATPLHGTGTAQAIYQAVETWMLENGAQWIRLGAVAGYGKPEGFWRKMGYTEVRKRVDVAMGQRVNTVRVLVKPLAGGRLDDYLTMVLRDRPGAA